MTARFYLAARYSRREELCGVRDVIQTLGGEVTSRWLNGNHQRADDGTAIRDDGTSIHGADDEMHARFALEDMEDVQRADVLIAFTETPRVSTSRGGRHVELGLALAWQKRVIVVGPRENVFCWLPQVKHFDSWRIAAFTITRIVQGEAVPS